MELCIFSQMKADLFSVATSLRARHMGLFEKCNPSSPTPPPFRLLVGMTDEVRMTKRIARVHGWGTERWEWPAKRSRLGLKSLQNE